jgi:hypothetical protein
VVLHGCTVEDDALIGMGAVGHERAVVGRGAVVAAGAGRAAGMQVPEMALVAGVPAKVLDRPVPDVPRINVAAYPDAGGRLPERLGQQHARVEQPLRSSAPLTACMAATSAGERESPSQATFARPTPCSLLMLPDSSATSVRTASVTARPASPASSTLTCRLPSLTCPKTISRADGAAPATAAGSRSTSSGSRPIGTDTSSLTGTPPR